MTFVSQRDCLILYYGVIFEELISSVLQFSRHKYILQTDVIFLPLTLPQADIGCPPPPPIPSNDQHLEKNGHQNERELEVF